MAAITPAVLCLVVQKGKKNQLDDKFNMKSKTLWLLPSYHSEKFLWYQSHISKIEIHTTVVQSSGYHNLWQLIFLAPRVLTAELWQHEAVGCPSNKQPDCQDWLALKMASHIRRPRKDEIINFAVTRKAKHNIIRDVDQHAHQPPGRQICRFFLKMFKKNQPICIIEDKCFIFNLTYLRDTLIQK